MIFRYFGVSENVVFQVLAEKMMMNQGIEGFMSYYVFSSLRHSAGSLAFCLWPKAGVV